MFPRLFTIPAFPLFSWNVGPLTLHTYGVLLAVAFLAGLFIASRQARKAGVDAARVTDMAVYVLIAGLVGAKLLLVIVDWKAYAANPSEIWSVWQSGGVFYGGLLGALPVAWWYARKHQLDR
jgi:phosphatidylglycerol---prolipoprotein diacylglyceryl transferase